MSNKKFHFQEEYEKSNLLVSADLWQKVERKLEVNDLQKKRIWQRKFVNIAAVFVLFFGLIWIFYTVPFSTKDPMKQWSKTEQKKIIPKSIIINKTKNTHPKELGNQLAVSEKRQKIVKKTPKLNNKNTEIEQFSAGADDSKNTVSKPVIAYNPSNVEKIETPSSTKYVNAKDLLFSVELENGLEERNKHNAATEEPTPNKKQIEIRILGFDVSSKFLKN